MRHIFGVAFSGVDLIHDARQELELLFLRVACAVLKVREGGEEAQGYVSVVRQEARDAVRTMKAAYGLGDEVRVVFASLLVSDLTRLADAAEKVRTGEDLGAEREVAGQVAADALRREVSMHEPFAVAVNDVHGMPFGVQWDFYGVVRSVTAAPDGQRDETICPRLL